MPRLIRNWGAALAGVVFQSVSLPVLADCSLDVGRAVINEYNLSRPNDEDFHDTTVEIKLLDPNVDISGWTLNSFSKKRKELATANVSTSGVGACAGSDYRVTPIRIEKDGYVQLLDADGRLVDTLYVDMEPPDTVTTEGHSCDLSTITTDVDIQDAAANHKNISRVPDGTGDWVESEGNGRNSEQTLCGSNDGTPPTGTAKGFDACSNGGGSPQRCSAAGNRLFTKATGQDIAFDLIALSAAANGSLDSSFNGTVAVDLVDNPSYNAADNSCATVSQKAGLAGSSRTVQFSGGYPQSPASYAYPAASNLVAAGNVRVRFSQGSQAWCSTDQFAIRPATLNIMGMNGAAVLDNAALAGNPVLAAGADFTLQIDGGAGYSGTPAPLDASLAGSNVRTHAGDATDRLMAKPPAGGSIAFTAAGTGATAQVQYHQYGYFIIRAGAVADRDFARAAGDIAGGDCTADAGNSPDAAGRIGCYVANQADAAIGRFSPDHFAVTGSSLTAGCLPPSPGQPFTYMGQPFQAATLQTRAESRDANLLLTLYDAATAAGAATLATVDIAARSGSTDLTARVAGWAKPFSWEGGLAGYAGNSLVFGRSGLAAANPDGPYSLEFRITVSGDPDLCPGAGKCLDAVQAGTPMAERYGRLRLRHAYGSRDAPLRLPVQAEYWNGSAWALNRDDSTTAGSGCTALADGHIALGDGVNSLQSTGITLAAAPRASTTIRGGVGSIFLPRPSGAGWRHVALNLAGTAAAPDQTCVTQNAAGGAAARDLRYLRFAGTTDGRWACTAGAGGSDPWARATFGRARTAGQTIYQRENF